MNTNVIRSLIIGAAIVITALILGSSFKNRNLKQDTISVTGLGSKDFLSDEISWSGSFDASAFDAKEAYNIISQDKEKVKAFFYSKGFKSGEFTFGGVNFSRSFRTVTTKESDGTEKSEDIFDGYKATQTVFFRAKKNPTLMKKIESVIDKTAELINSGVQFEPSSPQYTYSDLASLKHNLIEAGAKDARQRAEKIVKSADGDLGKLKDASMGVFQITAKGSTDEDSYGGNFDTSSKEKSARITVRLTYNLD
ncbi:SIMPL domain-containing protein [Chryseobacterium taichungense]|uniref:SIMPL domain-containing protein n=1 Tax=Chryseobacterium taichungense TaxID=295069 RepID=UPI0028AA7208|nr:SIMPL domain-containing protein [Chryseobacterium taichungense]